jgi:carboxymethylenebutenolidase
MAAADFDPELLEFYDFYAVGKITERESLDHAGKFASGGLTAAASLPAM